ncbi:hypothetical protein BGX38DRAFT_1146560 [Terfezia claveryi]|nr:hypothetical protein BGX38DRAFT_1146560 [Terfezia claveryi]
MDCGPNGVTQGEIEVDDYKGGGHVLDSSGLTRYHYKYQMSFGNWPRITFSLQGEQSDIPEFKCVCCVALYETNSWNTSAGVAFIFNALTAFLQILAKTSHSQKDFNALIYQLLKNLCLTGCIVCGVLGIEDNQKYEAGDFGTCHTARMSSRMKPWLSELILSGREPEARWDSKR